MTAARSKARALVPVPVAAPRGSRSSSRWSSSLGVVAVALVGAGVLVWAGACASATSPSSAERGPSPHGAGDPASMKVLCKPSLDDSEPAHFPGLHNVVAYAPGVYSGGVPEGGAGFEALRALGVRTIVSVDGAAPDVERARAAGMRYVHLPIGYNGFPESRKLELVRAVRDLPKPVYVHCHHGKHRSAGAVGAVAVSLGMMSPEDAVDRMRVSGTSPKYTGLFAAAREATLLSSEVIDAAPSEFPEVTRPVGLVKAMVEIDHAYAHLRAIEKAGWTAPDDHPDLVPVAEAGRLADAFRLLLDDAEVKAKPADFLTMMVQSAQDAQRLEDLLAVSVAARGSGASGDAQPGSGAGPTRAGAGRASSGAGHASGAPSADTGGDILDKAALGATLQSIGYSCMDCHVAYRD